MRMLERTDCPRSRTSFCSASDRVCTSSTDLEFSRKSTPGVRPQREQFVKSTHIVLA